MKMTPLLKRPYLLPAVCALSFLAGGCSGNNSQHAASAPVDTQLQSLGTVEVTARLIEIPEGAIFERDLYHYAGILKYEVAAVQRGPVDVGATIYVGHYDPWKPRADAADKQVKNVGGQLRQFEAGRLHHMALETPMDDFYLGAIVDKYFGKHTGPAYWAVWTNPAD